MNNMHDVVSYYLGDYASRIHEDIQHQLSIKLDKAGYPYCCFWSYLMNNCEKSKLIYRNFLLSDKVWERFLEYRKNQPGIVRTAVGMDLERFQVESRIYGPDDVINDENIPLMPLIRYAMGKMIGLPESMYDRFLGQARQQLREEPLLFELLEKLKEGFPITEEEVMRNG